MANRVLILVGLPGSGKSTFSNKLIEVNQSWCRVNQDDLKTRQKCELYCRKFLQENRNVVVDRCNFDPQQRSTWIRIAHEFGVPVDCIVFTADQQTCGERILDRANHPTGVEGDKGLQILRRFVKNYLPPTPESGIQEGIRRTIYVDPSPEPYCTPERVEQVLAMLQ